MKRNQRSKARNHQARDRKRTSGIRREKARRANAEKLTKIKKRRLANKRVEVMVNNPNMTSREVNCSLKVRFETEAKASITVLGLTASYLKARYYKCCVCAGWHVTTTKKRGG